MLCIYSFCYMCSVRVLCWGMCFLLSLKNYLEYFEIQCCQNGQVNLILHCFCEMHCDCCIFSGEKPEADRNPPVLYHNSRARSTGACNCGRKQAPRDDPFDIKAANYDFYQVETKFFFLFSFLAKYLSKSVHHFQKQNT